MSLPYPFSGPPPVEVPLTHAPLERVLAQVMFPSILNIAKTEVVAPFQEAIRHTYPLNQPESIHIIQTAGPGNAPTVEVSNVWRFQDKSHKWRVSLAPNFLALETAHYSSRTEFLKRMNFLIENVQRIFDPQVAQRVGLRYLDRLQGDAFKSLAKLINPDLLGLNKPAYQDASIHLLTQGLFNTEEHAKLNARWGMLPANATIDPQALEPIAEPSWVMDFDLFTDEERNFDAQELSQLLESFAERIYAVFRFMVTDKFLRFYGGKP